MNRSLTALVAMSMLWACNADDGAPDPTVAIASPVNGFTASGDSISVALTITDFPFEAPEEVASLMSPSTRARAAGPLDWLVPSARAHEAGEAPAGYVEVTIDGVGIAEEITASFEVSLDGIPSGSHTLAVELVYADGDALYPAVTDSIIFVVP